MSRLRIEPDAAVAVPRGRFSGLAGDAAGSALPGLRSPDVCAIFDCPKDFIQKVFVNGPLRL
jgi:hypothetical protein